MKLTPEQHAGLVRIHVLATIELESGEYGAFARGGVRAADVDTELNNVEAALAWLAEQIERGGK